MMEQEENMLVDDIVEALFRTGNPFEGIHRVKFSVKKYRKMYEERSRPHLYLEFFPEDAEEISAGDVLRRLFGPIPMQGLTNALARAKCDACASHCTPEKERECYKTFSAQSLAVTTFIRKLAEDAAWQPARGTYPDNESAETIFPTSDNGEVNNDY